MVEGKKVACQGANLGCAVVETGGQGPVSRRQDIRAVINRDSRGVNTCPGGTQRVKDRALP